MSRRRKSTQPVGDTIPGTAVALPRPTLDQVCASTARPVPAVPDQGDLVEHWHDAGLLDDEEIAAFGGEAA